MYISCHLFQTCCFKNKILGKYSKSSRAVSKSSNITDLTVTRMTGRSSQNGRVRRMRSVPSSLNVAMGDATPRVFDVENELEDLPVGYSAALSAPKQSWEQYQPLPQITEGFGQDETYKLAVGEHIDLGSDAKMYLYRKDEGTVSEWLSFKERSNLLSRDSEIEMYEKQFSFEKQASYLSSKISFKTGIKSAEKRILEGRMLSGVESIDATYEDDQEKIETEEADDVYSRTGVIPRHSQLKSIRSSFIAKSQTQTPQILSRGGEGNLVGANGESMEQPQQHAVSVEQQLEALRSFVAEENTEDNEGGLLEMQLVW